eukprot:TRINITY_DN2684_c0_g2_i3.p1 TRINITY_DN2684_c0_g2~~TRINITY_DN2684_c0_g2_i3.p1  ORF type:complete len:236 (+),score=95.36 TRINITY_DN2684_c0_g2_i3:72-710(+)
MAEFDQVREAIQQARVLDPEPIHVLEQYVSVQDEVEDIAFDSTAALALLKLYQFYPARAKFEVMEKILRMALSDLPNTTFTLCMFLIPERHHRRPEIESLLLLHDQLEECRFAEFWANPILAEMNPKPEFVNKIRAYIFDLLKSAHQRSDMETAAECLNMQGAELERYLAENSCEIEKGSEFPVRYALCEHNQKRPAVVQPSVQVEQVARIL